MKWLVSPVLFAGLFIAGVLLVRAQEQPVVSVRQPTVIAFFPHATDAELSQNPDLNEVLGDFQLYAAQAREPLAKIGVHFKVISGTQFQVQQGQIRTDVKVGKDRVGYYFVAPNKKPRMEYGVMTDADLVRIAKEYFGTKPAATSPEEHK